MFDGFPRVLMDLIWFVIDWSWTVGAPYLRLALVFSDLLINETSWGSTVTIFRNGIKIIEYRKIMQHYTNLHDIQTQRRWFLYERVTSWGSLLTNPCSKPFIVTAPECCRLWHLSSVDCTPSTTPEGNPALGGNPAPEKNPANKGNVEGQPPPHRPPHTSSPSSGLVVLAAQAGPPQHTPGRRAMAGN